MKGQLRILKLDYILGTLIFQTENTDLDKPLIKTPKKSCFLQRHGKLILICQPLKFQQLQVISLKIMTQ